VKLLVDKTGLHRTTFTRKSSKYRKLVLGFLNTQPGSSGNIDLKSMDIETLRIHAMTQQLELEEYKSELSKLNRKIKKLSLQKTVSDDTRFAETAMALMMVLERLSGVVSIDFDKQEIHDMTKYDDDPDRVIVKGHRAEPFFQLIHSEPDIFGLPSQEQKALSHE